MFDDVVYFVYLLKLLRTGLGREGTKLELYFVLLLGAVTVGAVIFLVPRIYRIRVIEVFLRQLIEIVIEARELASQRLQSYGAVHHLMMMIMIVIMMIMMHDLLPPVHHGLAGHPGVAPDPDKVQSLLPFGRLEEFPSRYSAFAQAMFDLYFKEMSPYRSAKTTTTFVILFESSWSMTSS